jgi:hypothetical protein
MHESDPEGPGRLHRNLHSVRRILRRAMGHCEISSGIVSFILVPLSPTHR